MERGIHEELRMAARATGKSLRGITSDGGPNHRTLWRFMGGENVGLDNAERIAHATGKRLVLVDKDEIE